MESLESARHAGNLPKEWAEDTPKPGMLVSIENLESEARKLID
jgi:hypothetical protein